MTRTAARRFGPILVVLLPLLVAACGGISLPGQPTTGAPTTGPTTAPGGSPGFSIAIGGAKDLEALLPSELCGQPSVKHSAAASAGEIPDASTNPYAGLFTVLGSGAFALAEPASTDTCKVSAGAFRLQGANQFLIQAFLLAAAADSSGQSTQVNLGGKAATKIDDETDETLYIYVKGDTIFVVEAPGDDQAGPVLSALP